MEIRFSAGHLLSIPVLGRRASAKGRRDEVSAGPRERDSRHVGRGKSTGLRFLNHHPRRGAAVVEFAFVFILFLVLILGLMEFGRAAWTHVTLAHAARRGLRFAMIHGSNNPVLDPFDQDITDQEIATAVKANAVGLDPNKIVVAPPTWTPDRSRGSSVEISVSYPLELVCSFTKTYPL